MKHEYYSRTEAAEYLSLSPHTLVEYHARGTGPKFIKTADSRTGHAIYRLRELRTWQDKRKAKAARTAARITARSRNLATKNEPTAPLPQNDRRTLDMQRNPQMELHRLTIEAIKEMRVTVRAVKDSMSRNGILRLKDCTDEQVANFMAEFPQVFRDNGKGV